MVSQSDVIIVGAGTAGIHQLRLHMSHYYKTCSHLFKRQQPGTGFSNEKRSLLDLLRKIHGQYFRYTGRLFFTLNLNCVRRGCKNSSP